MGAKARYIPEEIVLNILPTLPTDSLLRFRCVSKIWRSLITKGGRFIIKSGSHPNRFVASPCSIQSINETTGEIQDLSDDIPWETNQKIEIYGSCNGLLLIGYYDDLFLWNPSLGCKKKLFSYSPLSDNGPQGYRIVGGLCFDPENYEYKIVMALAHNKHPDYVADFVAVGSPRNRTWTHIRFPYRVRFVKTGPVLNNRLHWYVSNHCYPGPDVLLYFDTKINEFVKLPMPPPRGEREGKKHVIGGLGVLDGCLCMTRSEGGYEQKDTTVQVLGMMEYGVKESWSILFRIKGVDLLRGVVPLFFIGNQTSKVLVKAMKYPSDFIIIYDTVSELHTDVTSAEYMGSGVVYEETLVKPVGYGWEELDSRGEASYVEKLDSKYTRTMERNDRGLWSTVKVDRKESKEDLEMPRIRQQRKRRDASFWSKGKCPW